MRKQHDQISRFCVGDVSAARRGIPTDAASAATIGKTPLMNQTEGGAIVKVAEDCGIGNFRDEYGHCRDYGFGAPAAPPTFHRGLRR